MAPPVNACRAVDGAISRRNGLIAIKSKPIGTQRKPTCSTQMSGSANVRCPCHRATRTRFAAPATAMSGATAADSGMKVHQTRARIVAAMATTSNRPNGAGSIAELRLASQLRVKLGMMCPPTSPIRTMTTAVPRRRPSGPVLANLRASRWVSPLAAAIRPRAPSIGRLCQLWPATTSRVRAASRSSGNARAIAAAAGPILAEHATATRPATNTSASTPSRQPWIGRRPVQSGTAVRRKPAIAAWAKPNSISWPCQVTGSNAVGSAMCPFNSASHSGTAMAAHRPANRKNGRSPRRGRRGRSRGDSGECRRPSSS